MSDLAMHGLGKTRVNGILGDFLVQAGTADITAGDFVNFVSGIKSSGQVYKASPAVQAGPVTVSAAGGVYPPAAVQIDTDKVMLLYETYSGQYGTAVVITFSGTTPTVGTPLAFTGSTAVSSIAACLIDTNKVLVTYRGASSTYYGVAIVLSVSGTTITAGTALTFASETTNYHSVCKVDTGKAMAVYFGGSSSYGKAIILSVSGTTITAGTALTFASAAIYGLSCCLEDANKVFVAYAAASTINYVVLSVSGTTITAGTALTSSNSGVNLQCCLVSTGKVLTAYTSSYTLKASVCTISGTTVTEGTAVTIKTETSGYTPNSAAVLTSANHVIVSWVITGGSNITVKSVLLTISGTTITVGTIITLDTNTAATGRLASALLSTGKVMTAYYLSAAKIQVVDELTTTLNAVAKSSGVAGQTIRVYG